ncbi:MAG: DUF4363 family protein [Christensenellales bacterium]
MVKRAIIVIMIFLTTITFAIVELVSVKKVLTTMEDTITDLKAQYEINQDDITQYYDKISDVKEYWAEQEDWLCFLFNHRDLSTITDSINRLQAYTQNNDFDNAIAELSILREYATKNCHIMGFNIHNIL